MNKAQPFIGKKMPEEYFLEENLKQLKGDKLARRIKQRFRRKLTKVLVGIAQCLFKNQPLKTKLKPEQLRRVLVLRWDLLGDMVLTTPVFNFLKSIQPTIEIDVLASEKNVGIINGDERISKIFIFKKEWSFLKTALEIRRRRHDLVLSFIQIKSMADGLLSNFLAPKAVKASAKRKAKYRPLFNVCASVGIGEVHASEKFLAVPLAAIDAPAVEPQLSLHISQSAKQIAHDFIVKSKLERFVVVNTTAGGAHRQWGAQNYIEFLKSALEQHCALQFVMLSTSENIREVSHIEAAVKNKRLKVFPPQDDIQVVTALIAESYCVFSPDTSIVHIASAMRRPVLALYTIIATIPSEWLPYRVPYRALLADGRVPVSTIPVESVLNTFNDLISELQISDR